MPKYPNSECEAHRDVETDKPVCIICMVNEIDRLTQLCIDYMTNEGEQQWCVHILGPDDILAMASKEAAALEAAKINKSIGRNWQDGDPEINAIVIPWPGTAESHAAALVEILAESV